MLYSMLMNISKDLNLDSGTTIKLYWFVYVNQSHSIDVVDDYITYITARHMELNSVAPGRFQFNIR